MKTITKYWFLEGFNIFKKLGAINMMKISDVMEMNTVERGKSIELFGENKNSVFFLKKGSVKIVDNTKNTVKHIIKRGEVFGDLALYNKKAASEEVAYALEECVICYIESEKMMDLMDEHKSLKNKIFKVYGLRIEKLERRLDDLLYKDSSTRIREFIYGYLEEFGEKNESGESVAKNLLTHKDISNLTNTSRQTVSNVMSTMRKEGLIDYNARFISYTK